jgi:uncharacterized protein YjbI with pentapeptide repeats
MQIHFLEILAVVALFAAIWLWRKPDWMGVRGKSMWDWLALLAVPSLIGFGTVVINASQADIEHTRLQEQAIQQYIDRISELSLDERAIAHPQQSLAIGRAQTTAVLQVTDKDRTARVLKFLQEMDLLQAYAVNLEYLNFSGGELKGLRLDNMDLEGSNLRGADLENGSFRNVDLEEADLRGADLEDADFRGADFEDALMKGAELDHTDLRGADLSTAVGLTLSQLDDACVDETTKLPAKFNPVIAESAGCASKAGD